MPVTTITYSMVGEDTDKSSNFKVNIASSVSIANAIIWAQDFAKKVNAATDGAIVGISMSTDVSLPAGIRSTPTDGSRAERKGQLLFRSTNGYPTGFAIPTILEALVLDGTHKLDVEDDLLSAITTAIITGIDLTAATPVAGTGTVRAVETHADTIAALRSGKEIFD